MELCLLCIILFFDEVFIDKCSLFLFLQRKIKINLNVNLLISNHFLNIA